MHTEASASSPGPPRSISPPLPVRSYWLPRTIRPTREGIWFVLATFAVGLAAANTGNNLLYLILAMLLSFLIISGLLSEQTMRRVTVHRETPPRLFAETPAAFGVRLQNGKRRLASYGLHLEEADPAGGPPQRHFSLRLDAGARRRCDFTLTFPGRGWHRFPGLVLWTGFPFGLFHKVARPAHRDAVLVYPRLRALEPGEIPPALQGGWQERVWRGQGASLHNLRPYHAGDDRRLIHWRTSARLGDLMLKEMAAEDRPRIRIVVEDPVRGRAGAEAEAELSRAASLAAWAVRRGMLVDLVTAEGATGFGHDTAHLDRILTRLALYRAPTTPRPVPLPADGCRCVRVPLGGGASRSGIGEGG
jgi:uncharacterized protein (DUF58 family)